MCVPLDNFVIGLCIPFISIISRYFDNNIKLEPQLLYLTREIWCTLIFLFFYFYCVEFLNR
jgi:hypothetical protein